MTSPSGEWSRPESSRGGPPRLNELERRTPSEYPLRIRAKFSDAEMLMAERREVSPGRFRVPFRRQPGFHVRRPSVSDPVDPRAGPFRAPTRLPERGHWIRRYVAPRRRGSQFGIPPLFFPAESNPDDSVLSRKVSVSTRVITPGGSGVNGLYVGHFLGGTRRI